MKRKRYTRRAGRTNKHHILPKARGGISIESNLVLMDEERHNAYHLLFGLLTFDEAARVLIRISRMKRKREPGLGEPF